MTGAAWHRLPFICLVAGVFPHPFFFFLMGEANSWIRADTVMGGGGKKNGNSDKGILFSIREWVQFQPGLQGRCYRMEFW